MSSRFQQTKFATVLRLTAIVVLVLSSVSFAATTSDSLVWRTNSVAAEIHDWDLPKLLEKISESTGWDVYLEPGTARSTNVKFKNETETEALRKLLGNLSFTLMPETNSVRKLYVFHSSSANATQLIRAPKPAAAPTKDHTVPNQLVVRMKPGTNAEELAKRLHAKIVGRIPGLNTYLFEFANEADTMSGLKELMNDKDVDSVDFNYQVEPSPLPQQTPVSSIPPFSLKANPDPNHVVIGLVDSHVQPPPGNMQPFLKDQKSLVDCSPPAPDQPTHGSFMYQSILHSVMNVEGSGASSRVMIVAADVYGCNAGTTTFLVGQGIMWVVSQGATIVNLSLGSYGNSPMLAEIISQYQAQGVMFFAAAGNDGGTSPIYPAAYSGVIAVTASDADGKRAPYANHGSFVDLMLPGTDTGVVGNSSYQVSGTSSASALASGTAGGLEDSKKLSPTQVGQTLGKEYGFRPNTQ